MEVGEVLEGVGIEALRFRGLKNDALDFLAQLHSQPFRRAQFSTNC